MGQLEDHAKLRDRHIESLDTFHERDSCAAGVNVLRHVIEIKAAFSRRYWSEF